MWLVRSGHAVIDPEGTDPFQRTLEPTAHFLVQLTISCLGKGLARFPSAARNVPPFLLGFEDSDAGHRIGR